MEKIINVGGRLHNPVVGGALTGADEIKDDTRGKMQNVINQETDAELVRLDEAKQEKLTFDQTPTEGSTNPVTSGGVYDADVALQQAIEAILLLIPSAASALNQLADKSFVNSSIATATATFRGTYNLVTDLGLTVSATHQQIATALASVVNTADNNDYCFVQIPVSDQSTDIRVTERYKFDGTSWEYEYDLNNSGFTADQWAAINSGITSVLVGKLGALPTAAELATMFAGKQNTLTFDSTPVAGSDNPVKSSGLYNAFAAINALIPDGADANNKLVAESRLVAYVTTLINALDATFDVTSADGHVTLRMTQADGVITSVQILTSDIASASALTTLAGRVSTAESDIDALQDAYAALTQSDVVIVNGTLPSTGQQQNIIYRQPDQDHTPPQYYSDYMWNGTTWVLMAMYMNGIDPRPKKGSQNLVTSGGVFDNMGALDVSELNATENPHTLATYADLSAALAAIPSDYQKGGMSIKFVLTSDNKYVQYRYMEADATTVATFTKVTNWQGVTNEIKAGSMDLVESGAVNGLKQDIIFFNSLKKEYGSSAFVFPNSLLNGYGVKTSIYNYKCSDYINIEGNQYLQYKYLQSKDSGMHWCGLALYEDASESNVVATFGSTGVINLANYPTAKYCRMGASDSDISAGNAKIILYKTVSSADNKESINALSLQVTKQNLGEKETNKWGVQSDASSSWLYGESQNVIVTQKGITAQTGGILKSITITSVTVGTIKAIVGLLDQRGHCVPRITFDIPVSSIGKNTVDISNLNIEIRDGEQVFLYGRFYADNSGNGGAISFINASSSGGQSHEMLYGDITAELVPLVSTFGGRICLEYEVVTVNTDFLASKREVQNLNARMEVVEAEINKPFYVLDADGKKYSLKVVSGAVVPIAVKSYKSVYAVGNSLTTHEPAPSIGYFGNGWSMAATSNATSWTAQLQKILRQVEPTALVTKKSIYTWETNLADYLTDEALDTLFNNAIPQDMDLFIFKAGENIVNATSMNAALSKMVEYIQENYPNADILLGTEFWTNSAKDNIIRQVAQNYNTMLIESIGGDRKELLGDYLLDSNNDKHPIIHGGVAAHMPDLGFYEFANQIGSYFGMDVLQEAHTIQVTTSLEYLLNYVTGIKDSLITILVKSTSLPSAIVMTQNGDAVSCEVTNMNNVSYLTQPSFRPNYAITFVMPNTGVYVNIG